MYIILFILAIIVIVANTGIIYYSIKTHKLMKEIEELNEVIYDELSKIGMSHRVDFKTKYGKDLNAVCDTYNEKLANSIINDEGEEDDED